MAADFFNREEKDKFDELRSALLRECRDYLEPGDLTALSRQIIKAIDAEAYNRNKYGINLLIYSLETVRLMNERLGPDRNIVIAIMLRPLVSCGFMAEDEVASRWGGDVLALVKGLLKVQSLYSHRAAVESDNFRRLLMTFAEDIRVIITMIVDRLALMRMINHHPDGQFVRDVAYEANYLYAPLAHRLGLYSIKSELEDMSLKYSNREVYTKIAHELNQTKVARDAYIAKFIEPVKKKLEQAGLNFEIKGRTKSIYSIYNKIQKQHNDLEHIYDLFAIRIIIDTPAEKEKADCWLAYSVVTDMYTPNTARLKDWISIPKSNGYESLHITVNGPDSKWVEVQIRTRRMDLVAEKGLAAHWRYKGIKSESELDSWMNNVRDILEAAETGPLQLIRNFKMDIYDKEVFVFTPKGDLFKLPLGATILDFAFHIHSKLGCICSGGRVNGKHQRINYKLHSGDTVEILTSSQQTPKLDWLNFAVTSKARNKIRQTINEMANRSSDIAKEMLQRRFKNKKIELEEAVLSKVIKKLGFKASSDFYAALAEQQLDPSRVIDCYQEILNPVDTNADIRSAEEFSLATTEEKELQSATQSDVLIIGVNEIKGLNYKFARCCNPIFGDKVFGFVSSEGVVKIHRVDCPNASHIHTRYPYRVIPVKWSGKLADGFAVTISVVGNDDIGIVTNITSIINKEKWCNLRGISINSNDGLFQGHITVGVSDNVTLNNLIKKLKTVKGVKDVQRIN